MGLADVRARLRPLGPRSHGARPFWLLAAVRAAYWLGAALALVWAPAPVAGGNPDFRAYEALTDLLFGTFATWDAGWFLHLADHGYDSEQSTAFFPLYPLVVRGVALVTGSTAVAGVLVSLVAAGLAAVVLARLARPLLGERGAADTVLLLALFPVSFVFTALYSEGLFLLLAAAAFLAAARQRPWLAGALGALAVATRPVGLALLPALAVLLWPPSRRAAHRLAPLALLPVPLVLFGVFLERRFGSWRVFVDAQEAFWQRERPLLGPAGGLWQSARAAWDGTAQLLLHLPRTGETFDRFDQVALWYVLHFLLLAAAVWLTWVAWRRLGAAYGLYSAAFLAIVLATPSDWFPLMSLPRFLLGDFPLFLALAAVLEGRPRARAVVLAAFAAVGAAAAIAFSRGVWVA